MKAIIIGLLIAIMLIASGCNLTGGASTEIDKCSSIEESTLKDDCYLENLKCSKVENQQTRDSCVAELAKKT